MRLPKEIIEMIRTPELVPEGIYELEVDYVDAGRAQNGQSYRIIVNFHIARGEYETYEIRSVFTLYNPENFQSQRISRMLFRNLILAAGLTEKEISDKFDTDMLRGRKVMGHVIKGSSGENYPEQNRISSYFAITNRNSE